MRLSFFIAMRYFFSKKELKVINIISLISLIGVGVVPYGNNNLFVPVEATFLNDVWTGSAFWIGSGSYIRH